MRFLGLWIVYTAGPRSPRRPLVGATAFLLASGPTAPFSGPSKNCTQLARRMKPHAAQEEQRHSQFRYTQVSAEVRFVKNLSFHAAD